MKKNKKVEMALEIAEKMKAEDIKILDLAKFDTCGRFHVIMTATSPRHLLSLAREIDKGLKAIGGSRHSEGMKAQQWLLVDCEDTVIHVFTEESRKFYGIERLWETPEK
ncbi:MAG: ribosome silencing factor [Elusimicrobia bacterium CG_4_10_14_3_um_filter_49_12_50_7]|nr:MAG: ribosome silencing factor [Elusimicrobia bacterium CG03_land_8_20_14_0_80_50_18]PIX14114.1 MAG: ribosome silencing factor [Elusimicrobia bacterium CG_4_8_14_3_um_filter_50_9]PIY16671.1 MAG: ribosome silencing factor [Elusimicrobia bacterium CG_4_10_14_3_um_filter_49_12_50_7]